MNLLYRNITLTVYFSKKIVASVYVREIGRWRETKIDCHIDPFQIQSYVFSSLTRCSHPVFAREPLGAQWPLWNSKTQDYRMTVMTVGCCASPGALHNQPNLFWLQDWDWSLYLISAVGYVYINSLCPRIQVVTNVTCFRLFTQVCPAITLFTQLEHPALSKVNMQHYKDVFDIK